jgi:Zn-dependent peptidase ImmA (M78 family)
MTTTNTTGTLANLRALATEAPTSLTDLTHAAERQAEALREALAAKTSPLRARLADLIPAVCIEILDAMPVAGASFWGNGRWHIHVREGEPANVRQLTVLHELKHIIDHPLRRRLTAFTDADWEAMADYFATQVLTPPLQLTVTHPGRRNSYESSR